MIERIIDFSCRNKLFIFFMTTMAVLAGLWSMKNIPLDAIPDLSDTQVIVYSKWDQSPSIIEDQVTYPIVTSLLGMPKVKAVRGFSDYGFSYVYVIFNDGTDMYWARSRVQEGLSKITSALPKGVQTSLGPDASGLGWVLQYALIDKSGNHSLEDLRTLQDWSLRYQLQAVPGVAEVASLGGYAKQYQVTVDPSKLTALRIPLARVVDAVRAGNEEAGGRLIEMSGAEYMVRGHGYAKSVTDLENMVVDAPAGAPPVLLKQVATIATGPDIRRGIADIDGHGDVVSGTIVMRHGENALQVIEGVKEKLKAIAPTLPQGVQIDIVYDRSTLIKDSLNNLKKTLTEEMLIVSCVVALFLWHFPSALLPVITIPIAVIISFIFMHGIQLTSNIMSLAGIAISIGVLVDGAIVSAENVYTRLHEWQAGGRKGRAEDTAIKALKEVAPTVFFALLLIAVSFLPVFTLMDQEGRLFRPLAFSKTCVMAVAALLVITLLPAVRMMLLRPQDTYHAEERHPVSRWLQRLYEPACRFTLQHAKAVIIAAVAIVCLTIPVFMKLGSEFMPPLWEGELLYMPTTMPGISIEQAKKLLMEQDRRIKNIPEVDKVFGKAGRIDSATDPAPLSMMETVVKLKPEREWRSINGRRITREALINELDQAVRIPGAANAWTMPIKNRIDMLSTGMRTPVGVKIMGPDIKGIEEKAIQVEGMLKNIKGTRAVFAERAAGGYYLDLDWKRDQLAAYGLTLADAQAAVRHAIGGEEAGVILDGRARFSVNVRYPRDLRDNPEVLRRVLIDGPQGIQVPVGQVADIVVRTGPSMIRNENGLLTAYVYVDIRDRDLGSYVKEAQAYVRDHLQLPTGYALVWSGQYEHMQRVNERLKIVVPLTLMLIVMLLYANTRSWMKTGIVLLAVPFSLVGAVWLLWALDYNMSIAVWVGMIALMGLDAETGVLMLLFLDLAYRKAHERGELQSESQLKEAIVHGAVRRLRPKMMTVIAALVGLLPIVWAPLFNGGIEAAGADVMSRIAVPMIGGLITSFLLELFIYPPIYFLWKKKHVAV